MALVLYRPANPLTAQDLRTMSQIGASYTASKDGRVDVSVNLSNSNSGNVVAEFECRKYAANGTTLIGRKDYAAVQKIADTDTVVASPLMRVFVRSGEVLKVYCKVDFLFPAEDRIVIVDWKTGKEDEDKHLKQLTGYAAWAAYHLDRSAADVTPIVAYLQPEYREVGIAPTDADLFAFRERIERETKEMYAFCRDIEENIPLGKSSFPTAMNLGTCRFCNFQELCER